jgi:addiction module HigA family antidote
MRVHTHPGEILREEFMMPLGLSANALSRALDVPPNRITAIASGDRGVTPDTALRLARYFGTTPDFWLNLQLAHDLSAAQAEHGDEIVERVRPRQPAAA